MFLFFKERLNSMYQNKLKNKFLAEVLRFLNRSYAFLRNEDTRK